MVYRCVLCLLCWFVFHCSHDCGVKHFQISQEPRRSGSVYVLDRQFQSLQDLVTFYGEHDVPNVEAISGVRLTCPVDYSHLVGDAQTHELGHMVCHSDMSGVPQQSEFESENDSMLLSKCKTWHRKILETLKQSHVTSKTDAQNTIQCVTLSGSHEVVCTHKSAGGSLSENPKKFEKQPAIPDESSCRAVCSVHESSSEADGSASTASLYYSEPRDVDRNLSVDFMAHLLQQDSQEHSTDGKCICGLDLADSELPRGWSMHISTEYGTEGRVFFTSPTGETSWELPTIVSVDLSTEQQDRIRQLMIDGHCATRDVSSQQTSVSRQFSNSDKRISV